MSVGLLLMCTGGFFSHLKSASASTMMCLAAQKYLRPSDTHGVPLLLFVCVQLSTRLFGLHIGAAMVPLLDLANHVSAGGGGGWGGVQYTTLSTWALQAQHSTAAQHKMRKTH